MLVLMAFALVAGAATALSPCVLPVLPIALSVGATGGRRRPLGVVTGLVISFTFATVALVYIVDALGLPDGLLRTVAIVVLLGFGISLVVPWLSARVEAWISRVLPATGTSARGEGFGSGVLVGLSLGLVYAPCAGPILAGVITVSASQSFTAGRLAVALSYGIGSAIALYALMIGGRRITSRLSRHVGRLQMGFGVTMVAVALLMLGDYDTRFQTAIADDLPAFLVNPTKSLEETASARERLRDLRDTPRTKLAAAPKDGATSGLPVLGRAPDFVGNQRWFNTRDGQPLTLRELRGHVVLVDFWTYTCINCIRTLPHLKALDKQYRSQGLVIVGVHTPEFPFERSPSNVSDAIEQNGLRYPIAQDNDYATWNAYGNEYWPAEYFVDARGRVRYTHFGEGEYEKKEQVVRSLLAEAGRKPGARAREAADASPTTASTPESYLGAKRADRFANGTIAAGTQTFPVPSGDLASDQLAYVGRWRITDDAATAVSGSRLVLSFRARRVFLVLGSQGGRQRGVRVSLDGEAIPDRLAGADVHSGVLGVSRQRLYRLVELPRAEQHVLTLDFEPGVSGYAFTFG